jgi:hypothetical protein
MNARNIERTGCYQLTWDCARHVISIAVRVRWNYHSDLTSGEREGFRARFTSAVLFKWNQSGYSLEPQRCVDGRLRYDAFRSPPAQHRDPQWEIPLDSHGIPANIDFNFSIFDGHGAPGANWDMQVERHSPRSNVNPLTSNVNVGLNDEDVVLQHEFGHALGLPDEYNECTSGAGMPLFCHVLNLPRAGRYFTDSSALMSTGDDLRARYFFAFRDRLNTWTNHRYMFQVRPLYGGDGVGEDALRPTSGGPPNPKLRLLNR